MELDKLVLALCFCFIPWNKRLLKIVSIHGVIDQEKSKHKSIEKHFTACHYNNTATRYIPG